MRLKALISHQGSKMCNTLWIRFQVSLYPLPLPTDRCFSYCHIDYNAESQFFWNNWPKLWLFSLSLRLQLSSPHQIEWKLAKTLAKCNKWLMDRHGDGPSLGQSTTPWMMSTSSKGEKRSWERPCKKPSKMQNACKMQNASKMLLHKGCGNLILQRTEVFLEAQCSWGGEKHR